jgi:hypothetical protein
VTPENLDDANRRRTDRPEIEDRRRTVAGHHFYAY